MRLQDFKTIQTLVKPRNPIGSSKAYSRPLSPQSVLLYTAKINQKSNIASRAKPTANLTSKSHNRVQPIYTSTRQSSTQTKLSTTMPLQIRSITAPDEQIWKSLWEQYNTFYKRTIPTQVTQTTFNRFLDDQVRMYCALAIDESEQVIGFVTWYPHYTTSSIEEIVYLQDLFVDPSVRNKGTGRALIEHVYEHAKTIPVNAVYWNTQYFNYVGQILYNKVAARTDFVRYQKNF